MIRDIDYFTSFNPEEASKLVDNESLFRYRSKAFSDLIEWIYLSSKDAEVLVSNVRKWLGEPDIVSDYLNQEVLVYRWIGRHGPDYYLSATGFLCKNGKVISLAQKEFMYELVENIDKYDKNNDAWIKELSNLKDATL